MIYPKKPPPYPGSPKASIGRRNLQENSNQQKQIVIKQQFKLSKERGTIHKQTCLYDLKIDYIPDGDNEILKPVHGERSQTERLMESVQIKNPITVLKKHYQQNQILNTSRRNDKDNSRQRSNSKESQRSNSRKKVYSQINKNRFSLSPRIKVQPFIPINIPPKKAIQTDLKRLNQEYFKQSNSKGPQVNRQIKIILDQQKEQPKRKEGSKNQFHQNMHDLAYESDSLDAIGILQNSQDGSLNEVTYLTLKDKRYLKKLLKKVRKMTEQIVRLRQANGKHQLQLEHMNKNHQNCQQNQKNRRQLEIQNYKLQTQIQILKKQVQSGKRQRSIERLYNSNKKERHRHCDSSSEHQKSNGRVPQRKQKIKQVIIQKMVEVPKYIEILGPQRIVQKVIQVPKIVEVPKYIEIEKKSDQKIRVPQPQIITQTKYIEIQKPVYIDKIVYIDKPIYIDRTVERPQKPIAQSPPTKSSNENRHESQPLTIAIPYPYPYEIPVYIQKPCFQNFDKSTSNREQIVSLQQQNWALKQRNSELSKQNIELRNNLINLSNSLEIIKRHNHQKNRQVQQLLKKNARDYSPIDTTASIQKYQADYRYY